MPKYAIMRTNKKKMSDADGIQREANRSPDDRKNFVASDIDWEKTKDNIYLVRSDNFRQSIKEICESHGITKVRKDAVAFLDSFFGASPEFFEKSDRDTILAYFNDCLKFAKENLGEVFNARIHVDETTFHMTLQSVPIVQNDNGSFSLSAKRLMGTPRDYHERQELFFTEVAEKYGFDHCQCVEDAVEKREHLDVLDYKLKMRGEELEKVSNDVEIVKAELEVKTEQLESVNAEVQLKTGVLEAAFEKIESCCRTFYKYAQQIYRSFVVRISDFLDKIAEKRTLTDHDFEIADMKKEEISSNEEGSLVLPVTSAGDRLTWDGHSPVYQNDGSECYYPFGSIDNSSGEIEPEEFFEWYERFPEDGVDDFEDPAETEFYSAIDNLDDIEMKIGKVLGKNPDVDLMNELVEKLDSPTPDEPDKIDDDSYNDVEIG